MNEVNPPAAAYKTVASLLPDSYFTTPIPTSSFVPKGYVDVEVTGNDGFATLWRFTILDAQRVVNALRFTRLSTRTIGAL